MRNKAPIEDGHLQFTLRGDWQVFVVDGEQREAGSQNIQRVVSFSIVSSWNYFDKGFVINYKDNTREIVPWTALLGTLIVHSNSDEYQEAYNDYLDTIHNKHADIGGLRPDCVRCLEQHRRDEMVAAGFIFVDPEDNSVDHGDN